MSKTDEVRELVKVDDVENALAICDENCSSRKTSRYRNEIFLQISNWRNLIASERKGILSRDEFLRENRKIKIAILDFLDEVEELELVGREQKTDVLLVTTTKIETIGVLNAFHVDVNESEPNFLGNKTYTQLGTVAGAKAVLIRTEMGASGPGGSSLSIWILYPSFRKNELRVERQQLERR